jgi:hypothetical protein
VKGTTGDCYHFPRSLTGSFEDSLKFLEAARIQLADIEARAAEAEGRHRPTSAKQHSTGNHRTNSSAGANFAVPLVLFAYTLKRSPEFRDVAYTVCNASDAGDAS